jgi:aspartyl protease family protein
MSFMRLIVFGAAVVAVAVSAPKVAPGLIAYLVAPAPEVASANAPVPVSEPAPDPRQVALRADRNAHFTAEAIVNGRTVSMMVDTGATTVVLSAETAARLGIHPAKSDYTLTLSTANGALKAAPVVIDEIDVGGILVRQVEAVVVPIGATPVDLLGMTFLKRLSSFEARAGQLVLVR